MYIDSDVDFIIFNADFGVFWLILINIDDAFLIDIDQYWL